ncbi:MAG: tetratricopeptide repeat protein [Thermoanaerobaculia bacterium]
MRSGIVLSASLLLLGGCASVGPTDVSGVTRALRQRGVDPASVVVPFEVTDEMRAWVHERVPEGLSSEARLDRLLGAIVGPDGLNLQYTSARTGTAGEAFSSRLANCLGFTSLFVGLAREVGVQAFYLQVDDVERFEREGDLLVVSGHVNAGFDLGGGRIKILEFTNAPKAEYRHVRRLADLTAISLYHSNRGAELLRAGRSGDALPWLRKAVEIDPDLGDAWVNLGVATRRAGDYAGAEAAYRRALEADPDGASAYQNLAALLRIRGRVQESEELMAVAARSSSQNLFSYLALGDLSREHGRTEEAKRYYRRALWLGRDDPEPYAALGQLALDFGDRNEAKKWLRKASALNRSNERVRRLESKLAGPAAAARAEGDG